MNCTFFHFVSVHTHCIIASCFLIFNQVLHIRTWLIEDVNSSVVLPVLLKG